MTLNITVVSRGAIYQCSDFRLADFRRDAAGNWIPLEHNSPKLITLQYRNWAGFLSYCGIGKWDTRSTYEVASEWIKSAGKGASFDDVAAALAASGSTWIDEIQRRLGRFQGHTFVIAGYESAVPRIGIVSNTHSTKGSLARHTPVRGLISTLGSDAGTHVYVTGLDNAVPRNDRIALKRLVAHNVDANVVRHRLARINAAAAQRTEARNGISQACMCYSISSVGEGAGEVYGQLGGRFAPVMLMDGMNLTEMMGKMGLLAGAQVQLRGSAFATSGSSAAVAAEQIDCHLGELRVDEPVAIVGHDLGQINEYQLEIASANKQGTVVGQVRFPVSAPPRAFIWVGGTEEIRDLGTLGGSMSAATDVNRADVVVGSSATVDGASRAVMWRGGVAIDLGSMDANNANALAINDADVIVGCIYRSPATPLTDYHRAFRWTEASGMTLIDLLGDRWSEARDINNRGQILGAVREGGAFHSFVYSEGDGLSLIKGPQGRPFYASSINDFGVVVGEADDEAGVRKAMIWDSVDGLRSLEVPFSFHPISIDSDGNIVGHDSDQPWSFAWLRTADGRLVRLPATPNHNTDARRIVGGRIFGHLRRGSWKHVHPVCWEMRSGAGQTLA